MKKAIYSVIITASIVALSYGGWQLYLFYKSQIKPVEVFIKDLTINKINLTIFLQLINDSAISATVREQNYDVLLNNQKVSEIKIKDNLKIKSNSPTVIPVQINVETRKLANNALSNLLNLLQDRNNIVIEVKGYLSLSSGIINLKKFPIHVKYTLQELIDLSKKTKTN